MLLLLSAEILKKIMVRVSNGRLGSRAVDKGHSFKMRIINSSHFRDM